ncbi:hypothetical protein [Azospirillum brasilense]|uniref:hypothetical protein n=1 Tax=Azospirillum brasilense TaxID=192 RepID=UPI0011C390C8|nr:hypothetical protein [Azospirillum brasilense]NUB24309.1 hypothetical protein [Azospirillum brasilense]NUB34119.1 hypothetical protein [Azospirillum brasilense]
MMIDVSADSVTVVVGGEAVYSYDPAGSVLVTPDAMALVVSRLNAAAGYAASVGDRQGPEVQAPNVDL